MHLLFIQLSCLIGLLIFLSKLWKHEPLDVTLFQGCAAGLVVYFALVLSDAAVRRILAHTPPHPAGDAPGTASEEDPAAPAAGGPDEKKAAQPDALAA